MNKITINCDMGEGCDTDTQVMPYLDCANISCGAHAGTPENIKETVAQAKKHHVIIGAHPGYRDPANFGRQSLNWSYDQVKDEVLSQYQFLEAICNDQSVGIHYIKPHGALNHDMLAKLDVFDAICSATQSINPALPIMVPIVSNPEVYTDIAKTYHLDIIWEAFADRAYENNGLLRNRKLSGAVHDQAKDIILQWQEINQDGHITSYDKSSKLSMKMAQSVCIHGDNEASILAVSKFRGQT